MIVCSFVNLISILAPTVYFWILLCVCAYLFHPVEKEKYSMS